VSDSNAAAGGVLSPSDGVGDPERRGMRAPFWGVGVRAPALVTGIAYYDGDEWPVGYRGGDGIAWFRRPPPYKADWEGRTDPFVTAFETEALSAWVMKGPGWGALCPRTARIHVPDRWNDGCCPARCASRGYRHAAGLSDTTPVCGGHCCFLRLWQPWTTVSRHGVMKDCCTWREARMRACTRFRCVR